MAGKTEWLRIRIGPEERAQVVATGQALGLNLSAFVRTAVLERSELERVFLKEADLEGGSNGG